MSVINVTVSGTTNQTTLVDGGQVYNVTFADQSGGDGTGTAATIQVGTVASLDATATPSVVNSGTAYAAKLDFGFPRPPANALSIGTVASGTVASATITGQSPSQTLSLVLPAGPASSLSIGTVTGGADASATITGQAPSQTLSLVLPQGPQGQQGIQGIQGEAGPANSLSVGSVTTGTTASVSITGTAPSQQISFVLQPGPQGVAGPYTDIKVGTVTTVSPTSSASITTTGSGGTVTLNFAIPRGVDGTANLGDETPQPLGTASAGTAGTAARADHVHAVPTISYTNLTNVPTTFTPAAHTQAISTVTGLQEALDGKQASGDYATLDGSGRVPSSQLPGFIDDVVEHQNLAAFPGTGEVGKLYVARDTNKVYRWSGSTYVEISASPGSTDAVPEGSVNLYHTTQRAAAAAPVQSVAGRTGTVTLTNADVGLGSVPNVDATARANHTGTQAASTISDFATEAAKYGPVTSVNGQTGAVTVSSGGGGGGAASVSYDYATTSALPATGDAGLLYCTTDNGRLWRWTGSVYAEVGPIGGGGSGEDLVLRSYFAPPAPTGVTAVGGNAQASVTWTAPAALSVLPITDYVVEFKAAGSSEWQNFSDGTSTATSATVTALDNGTGYTFRVSGVNAIGQGVPSAASASVTPAADVSVQALVIAGGAGGAGQSEQSCGGGGAGGFRSSSNLQLVPGQSYTVTVGAGGAGGNGTNGTSGSSSTLSSITSAGGGGGGRQTNTGLSGGSGGGSGGGASGFGAGNTPSTTPAQGNNGGTSDGPTTGGGGGGAGSAGGNGSGGYGGAGGSGASSSITGSAVTYAGGGGGGGNNGALGGSGGGGNGGGYYNPGSVTSGEASKGAGGGGLTAGGQAGSGGSGLVIIRSAVAAASTTGSPTVTTVGGDTVYTFTGSGSITF
jgi:hypothetical protein